MNKKEFTHTFTISGNELHKGAMETQLIDLASKWGAHFKPTLVKQQEKAAKKLFLDIKNNIKVQCQLK